MIHTMLVFLSTFFLGVFVVLLVFTIARKFQMHNSTNESHNGMNDIKERLEKFLYGSEGDFRYGMEEFVKEVSDEGRKYRTQVDEYLQTQLELPHTENRERYRILARNLDFNTETLAQIKSYDHRRVVHGYRKAGLYNITEALDEMFSALEYLSSENQFEILMAISRMGKADAMLKAIDKIKNNVIISEQALMTILSAFPDGDEKLELFRSVIRGDVNYLVVLFLKSAKKNVVIALEQDIAGLLQSSDKLVRAAAIRSLSELKENAPINDVICALSDSDWEVRAIAAKALGCIETPESSFALFKTLNDQQWWVRQNAVNALTGHHGYETLFILASELGDEYTRDSIYSVLENGGSPLLLRSIKLMTV